MGRLDIAVEVSMISSYVAIPRDEHLQHMFHNSRIVTDPTYPDFDEDNFQKEDLEDFL